MIVEKKPLKLTTLERFKKFSKAYTGAQVDVYFDELSTLEVIVVFMKPAKVVEPFSLLKTNYTWAVSDLGMRSITMEQPDFSILKKWFLKNYKELEKAKQL